MFGVRVHWGERAMAGFLDGKKPSRLLQDVKTKSIERTLLPLIKQVRVPTHPSVRWRSENFLLRFIHVCRLENWMERRGLKLFCE